MTNVSYYSCLIQYGLSDMRFELEASQAEDRAKEIDAKLVGMSLTPSDMRISMWELVTKNIEQNLHLGSGPEAEAIGTVCAWLGLNSRMHRERPEYTGFVFQIGPRPEQFGIHIDASNPYAEFSEEHQQLFAVGKMPTKADIDYATDHFRNWVAGVRTEAAKHGVRV